MEQLLFITKKRKRLEGFDFVFSFFRTFMMEMIFVSIIFVCILQYAK